MPFDLPRIARQQGLRRAKALRPIAPTNAQANDLASILLSALGPWAEGRAAILVGYNPTPLTGDNIPGIDNAINEAAAEFARRLVVEITPRLRRWAVAVERWHRSRWGAAVVAGTGVDLSMMLTATAATNEALEAFIARNVALAKDLSAQAQQRIADAVYRGYQSRTPIRTVAKEIAEATRMGRARARRIASDQVSKIAAALDIERQAEAGLEQYRWRHSGKLHPRQHHLAREGNLFKLNEPVGDRPGHAPFCGCRAQAWIPLVDELGL